MQCREQDSILAIGRVKHPFCADRHYPLAFARKNSRFVAQILLFEGKRPVCLFQCFGFDRFDPALFDVMHATERYRYEPPKTGAWDSGIKYSFVVPIFNDGYLSEEFCEEYLKVFQQHLGEEDISSQVELIFVNDGSRDNSAEILSRLPAQFPFVRVINLSRNFGQHIALSCGYHHSCGQFVGMLNVDLQEHPDQIPGFLHEIEYSDCDIVFGLRRRRAGSNTDSLTSRLFGVLLNKLTGYDVPLDIATLRVMNRRFLNAYNSLSEGSRYLPGLESWLGYKRGYVEITHQERRRGKSSYNFKRRLTMAAEAIISFSDLPLRITVLFGFSVVALSFTLALALVIQKLFFVDVQLGYTSTICVIVFLAGVQLTVTGIASLYIGRILREVQQRPLYLIRDTLNLEKEISHGDTRRVRQRV
jgi:dolichol-phosphate mannosyltransferase